TRRPEDQVAEQESTAERRPLAACIRLIPTVHVGAGLRAHGPNPLGSREDEPATPSPEQMNDVNAVALPQGPTCPGVEAEKPIVVGRCREQAALGEDARHQVAGLGLVDADRAAAAWVARPPDEIGRAHV